MPILCVTHSGKFHADDVFGWAMLQYFMDDPLSLSRTRDENEIAAADIVFDVGGIYDASKGRFDHHQREYTGQHSSAGMILGWLEQTNKIDSKAAKMLFEEAIDYVDAVDNGRQVPLTGSACIANIIDSFNAGCENKNDFDIAFSKAATFVQGFIDRLMKTFNRKEFDRQTVLQEMQAAEINKSNLMFFKSRVDWKDAYFDNGGEGHPTEFVLYPNLEGSWQAIAIPPTRNSFAQKKSFPENWAGLKNAELAMVTGKSDAVFCHKNRFIAVFRSKESLIDAMKGAGLTQWSSF